MVQRFDGDEMNGHEPQTFRATVEASTLMRAAVHIVTGQRNAPINGIVQDGLVGAFLLTNTWDSTQTDTMVRSSTFMNCVNASDIRIQRYDDMLSRAKKYYPDFFTEDEGILKLVDNIPGKLMASILFPPNFCYSRKTDTNSKALIVKIEDGIILPDSGPLCKKIIGAKGNSVIHILWKEYAPEIALSFLCETQLLIDNWLPTHGFSMGISDCLTTSREKLTKTLTKMYAKVDTLITSSEGRYDDDFEAEMNSIVNSAMNIGPTLAKTSMKHGERNALNIMRLSGAKGSVVNLSQIVGFVGQQNIDGRRIPMTLSDGTRTLPHFEQNDNSAGARGFVGKSYIDGLSPSDTFFHSAGGRKGIIATAIKTAETGYIQKRIGKKVEDLKIIIDGSVRNANGRIVQFFYGDDGMDPKKLYYPRNLNFPFFINPVSMAKRMNSDARRDEQVIEGDEPRKLLEDEIDLLLSFIVAGSQGLQSDITRNATENCRKILHRLLNDVFIYEFKIPLFCAEIRNMYETSKAQYGDMVGLLAASSIGEPTTQLSESKDTRIIIRMDYKSESEVIQGEIGQIIDELLEKDCNAVFHLRKDSVVASPNTPIFIATVNRDNEKVEWRRVSQISRHPANGGMVKVTTKSGRSTTTTLTHSHLQRTAKGKIIPKVAKNLRIGDFIPVCGKMTTEILFTEMDIKGTTFDLDFDNGWLIGAYLSEGYINKTSIVITNISSHFEKRCNLFVKNNQAKIRKSCREGKILPNYPVYESISHHISGIPDIARFIKRHCSSGSKNKHIPGFSLFAPEEFVSGLLRGYFDGDGNVNSSRQLIRVHSISKALLEGIALLLSRFGIFGTFGVEKKKRENKLLSYKILRKHASKFYKFIGSDFPDKIKGIKEIIEYNERDMVFSRREDIDRVPNVGKLIADAAKPLKLPGYSRNYKRWLKKPAAGRETLRKYLEIFTERSKEIEVDIKKYLKLLDQSVNNDVIWDEIVDIEYLDDPKEFVYDIGVRENNTFMILNGIFVHNTLNIFHLAGYKGKDVSLGVPRFNELLNTTQSKKQKKPSCTIFFEMESNQNGKSSGNQNGKCSDNQNGKSSDYQSTFCSNLKKSSATIKKLEKENLKLNQESKKYKSNEKKIKKCKKDGITILQGVKKAFEETTVKTFFMGSNGDYEMFYVPNDVDPKKGSSPIKILPIGEYKESWWVKLDKELGHEPEIPANSWVILLKLDVEEMYRRKIDIDDIVVAIENHSEGKMCCIPSPNNLGLIEIHVNFSEIEEHTQTKIELPPDSKSKRGELLNENNINYFLCRDMIIEYIKDIYISGVPRISKVYPREETSSHEWVMDTKGSNFLTILATDGVDFCRTMSDDMWEICEVLGIEAARKFLIEEMTRIISFDGTYINPRHIQLLVDSMTYTGEITSVRRHGIPRDVGPIAKIMFERAVDNAMEAAIFTESDPLKSVSSSIMYGMTALSGTGVVNIKSADKMVVNPVTIPIPTEKKLPIKSLRKKKAPKGRRPRIKIK